MKARASATKVGAASRAAEAAGVTLFSTPAVRRRWLARHHAAEPGPLRPGRSE